LVDAQVLVDWRKSDHLLLWLLVDQQQRLTAEHVEANCCADLPAAHNSIAWQLHVCLRLLLLVLQRQACRHLQVAMQCDLLLLLQCDLLLLLQHGLLLLQYSLLLCLLLLLLAVLVLLRELVAGRCIAAMLAGDCCSCAPT
jgi:hypothetical protein